MSVFRPARHAGGGTDFALIHFAMSMHSFTKEQREAVRQLVQTVIVCDLGNFNPERFMEWAKQIDARFRKVAMMMTYSINDRKVRFYIKEVRARRTVFQFTASTNVHFEDHEVTPPVEAILPTFR